jgi:hypothetical protein
MDERGRNIDANRGLKRDTGKPRISLIPPEIIFELAKIFTFGEQKYNGAGTWQLLEDVRFYDALQRHLIAWQMGEVFDPESDEFHSSHALWNMLILCLRDIWALQGADGDREELIRRRNRHISMNGWLIDNSEFKIELRADDSEDTQSRNRPQA